MFVLRKTYDALNVKFKDAIANVERETRVSAGLRAQLEAAEQAIAALKPDAEKWRDYLKRARDRKQAKKDATNDAAPKVAKKGAR